MAPMGHLSGAGKDARKVFRNGRFIFDAKVAGLLESLGVKAEMDQNDLDERLRMMRAAGVQAELMGPEALATQPQFCFP